MESVSELYTQVCLTSGRTCGGTTSGGTAGSVGFYKFKYVIGAARGKGTGRAEGRRALKPFRWLSGHVVCLCMLSGPCFFG